MSQKVTGGPAFPLGQPRPFDNEGMTLRDWFAGMAMQGLLVCPHVPPQSGPDMYARDAYTVADAMLAERDK